MKAIAITAALLLATLCVGEAFVIARMKAPTVEYDLLRKANSRRQQFCAAYSQWLIRLPPRLTGSDATRSEAAARELDALSSDDFLLLCGVTKPNDLAKERVEAARCAERADYVCVHRFAQVLLISVPTPPKNYVE